jgi:hypothetical protein
MPQREIQRSQAVNDPTIIWSTFIDLISGYLEDLDPEQRPHFVLIYDSEVQNGGHLLYFFNRREQYLQETLSALTLLGADDQRSVLEDATLLFDSRPRKRPSTPQEYSTIAMQGEFDNFDKRYRDCAPSLGELLGKHLTEHVDTFIRLV